MSIIVKNLTKIYGDQRALDNISFESVRGKITGFLGPNGAGKSTTMKIASGYLMPSEGRVQIDGIDVVERPLRVKKRLGYLPEHNPLYPEMYVKEYLAFIGAAYRLKDIRKKVAASLDQVGLTREQHKKIGTLSKGYRQRVGLAQALIHNPSTLILDEPTSGLDPNQLLEIRKVIKEISIDKAVLFSTHIMQEVEAICDEVVIINKGKLVANDKVDNLKSNSEARIAYTVVFEDDISEALFEGLVVNHKNFGEYQIHDPVSDARKKILSIVSNHSLPLVSITRIEASLEAVFQNLTQP